MLGYQTPKRGGKKRKLKHKIKTEDKVQTQLPQVII